jgi:hypothetical protein
MSEQKEKVPVFKNWSGWYILVLTILAIQILFYFYLTGKFS